MDKRGACWVLVTTGLVFAACSGEDAPNNPRGSAGSAARGGTSQGKAGSSPVTRAQGGAAGDPSGAEGGAEDVGGASNGAVGGALAGSGNAQAGAGGESGEGLADSVTFTIVPGQDAHAISPLIYGATVGKLACNDPKARFTLCRAGDESWSAYNWENNASNAGLARCFENNAALSASSTPGAAATSAVDAAVVAGATAVVTVPMLDYVAADKLGGSAPPACSGDVTESVNYLATRFKRNRPLKGATLALQPDTTDAFVNQDEFVAFMKNGYADQDLLFALDHETEVWDVLHEPLHPAKPTYAEIVGLNVAYAKAIKSTWPEANVMGFVGYGFQAAISLQNSPDYLTDGRFFDYYLAELKAASQVAGTRLIDYVDLHYYSEANGDGVRVIYEDTTTGAARARVQAARSLWDPDFLEGSWINSDLGNKPIELIPWLQGIVADRYAGTKLSLSEWSFGGGQHISGAIAAADALGIFGREGVDLAAAIALDDAPFLVGAFQIYRNYDGADNGFGDTSVYAASSDLDVASVYASVDAADSSRVVIVAINRSVEVVSAAVEIDHPSAFTSLKVYRITGGQPEPAAAPDVNSSSSNTFSYDMPGHSVSVLLPTE